MRTFLKVMAVFLLLFGAGAGYIGYKIHQFLVTPLSVDGGQRRVDIAPGSSFATIVRQLAEADILAEPLLFELLGRYRHVTSKMKAGAYAIDLSWTPDELLAHLAQGTLPNQIKLVIPEGFNRWQIANALQETGLGDPKAFLARVEREGLEGRLFPDTYAFDVDASTDRIVDTLLKRFDAVANQLLPPNDPRRARGPARDRWINLASLVEKEARTAEDRPKVARVFENRLKVGMKLQTDPTCVYGADTYTEVPHPKYCKDPKNRYSTYLIEGLPPTPIANPGRAALEAVLSPYTGPNSSELLYFVARRDGSGAHDFSQNFGDHQRAVKQNLGRERGRP